MLTVYTLVNDRLERGDESALSAAALWVDLLEPTLEEEAAVEALLGLDIPTREEMQEIEASSRLYREGEALFMTAPVLTNSDTHNPQNSAISFILTRNCTVTVRYATPQPFVTFGNRAVKQKGLATSPEAVLLGLLEAMVDRLADVLERIGSDLDALSHDIFRVPAPDGRRNGAAEHQDILRAVGRHGDLSSKARDSLLGLGRITTYLGQEALSKDGRMRVKTLQRDTRSLTEHAAFLSGKINFLLDATLGMINIEQNNIIRLFSVIAGLFLPPTLIASIYGMNFEFMPELGWKLGYPLSLLLMLLSALVPLAYFKRKGWL